MKRRTSLKAIAAASVGALAIGYWARGTDSIRDLMNNSFFKPTEQDLITSIADTIIPNVDGYGAVTVGVPIYLLAYLEKCEEPQIHENIKKQLRKLDESANTTYGHDFNECNQLEREGLLAVLSDNGDEQEKEFFDLIKTQTIHGFLTSEEIKKDRYHYRIAPRHYQGCIDINEKSIT